MKKKDFPDDMIFAEALLQMLENESIIKEYGESSEFVVFALRPKARKKQALSLVRGDIEKIFNLIMNNIIKLCQIEEFDNAFTSFCGAYVMHKALEDALKTDKLH